MNGKEMHSICIHISKVQCTFLKKLHRSKQNQDDSFLVAALLHLLCSKNLSPIYFISQVFLFWPEQNIMVLFGQSSGYLQSISSAKCFCSCQNSTGVIWTILWLGGFLFICTAGLFSEYNFPAFNLCLNLSVILFVFEFLLVLVLVLVIIVSICFHLCTSIIII